MGSSQQAAQDGNIYSVTKEDARKLRQKQANASFGATIGGTWLPVNPTTGFMGGIGVNWLYDNRNMLVQLDAQIQGMEGDDDEEAYLFNFGISAYYPLRDEDWTPFLGGGVSYASFGYTPPMDDEYSDPYFNDDSENGSGIMLRAGGGLLFSRTSTVNIRLRSEYTVTTFKVNGHLAHGLWVGVDAGFGR